MKYVPIPVAMLAVGQPLPILPVWLDSDFAVALDLESSYQAACQALRLT